MSLFTQRLSQPKLQLRVALTFLAVLLLFSLSLSTAPSPASFAQQTLSTCQSELSHRYSNINTSTSSLQDNIIESIFSLCSSIFPSNFDPIMLAMNRTAPQ